MSQEKVQLTVSGILADLDEGLTRDQIKDKYGLSHRDMTELFKHESLKNKKPRKPFGFTLVDDTNNISGSASDASHSEGNSQEEESQFEEAEQGNFIN